MVIHSNYIAPTDSAEPFYGVTQLVDLMRWRAHQHPNRMAYTFLADGEHDERRLTFGEVDRRAAALAAQLQARGLQGERALLVFDPGLDYIVAFYACLYAGVIAVPVYPPDPMRLNRVLPRLMSIVAQADARAILSTTEILGWSEVFFRQAQDVKHILATDTLDLSGAGAWTPPVIHPDSTAFLQYTSGSSGDPKGVILTHGNLLTNMAQMGRIHHPDARAVFWLPPYHDMGLIGGIMLLAYRGCEMVLMSPLSFVQRPLRWLEAISRYRATSSGSPNFGYELCVKKIEPADCVGLDLSSWILACNGSEPIRPDTLQRFYEKFAPYGLRREAFCPCYGMAETTLMVSCARLDEPPFVRTFDATELESHRARLVPAEDPQARALVSSGRPVDDEVVLIVDPETHVACPENHVGEIWVSGDNVAQGYWNRPEESQATFAAHLAKGDRRSFLRTGDLGFVHQRELFVTGRIKDLIIVAGRNHYPQDIERTVQATHPALRQDGGAVFALEVDGEERVVVVHEVTRPRKLDLDELVQQVHRAVTETHDVPVESVVLIQAGSLPKTSSGKIQRHACKQMFLSGDLLVLAQWQAATSDQSAQEAAPFEPPRTNTEELLAGLWSEVLGVPSPGRRDNFFMHGCHSLLATQLMTRIGAVWEVELPLATLFEAPTLAGLAERIDRAQHEHSTQGPHEAALDAPALVPVSREQSLPLSYSQQGLWFLDQLEPGNPFYNLPTAAELKGPLDVSALRRSLDEVVRRHEILRTVFPMCDEQLRDGQPRQQVLPPAHVPLEEIDLRRVAESGRECELRRRMTVEARKPFDLVQGPLVRATLFRLAADEHVLLLCMHHIVSDGWSMGVLVRETSAMYDSLRRNQPSPLPELAIQYADFAAWQRTHLEGARLDKLLGWWQRRLDGAPRVLDLPTDHPRPATPTFAGALESRVLPTAVVERLNKIGQTEGVSVYMLLLAALDTLLARYTGQEDIVVGSPFASRNRSELEPLIGFFANTLVLRTDVSGDPTFRELLARVRRVTLDAHMHQEVPFEKLVERLEPERSRQRSPLFQVALVLENAPLPLEEAGALRIRPLIVDNGTAKYDLTLYCWPQNDGIELVAEYSTELFDRATITRLLAGFESLLAAAVTRPDRRLSELPVTSDDERRQLLLDRNDTRRPIPQRTLPELFAAQAARSPNAIAVTDDSTSLTYAELDRRANQLAHYLQALGVGPDVLVGVCLDRSVEMLVGLLGVLKAGGAYVPLDPAYPQQRLAHMLADAQVRVLLTQTHLLPQLPPHDAEEVLLDADWNTIQRESESAPPSRACAEHLAYTIYTSGSTGLPKGVEITHHGLVNFLTSFANEPGLDAKDTLLAVTTLSFDIAALEMFLPLVVGARVVIATRETAVDGRALGDLLNRSQASFMQATPATWRLLVEADWRPQHRFKILCGGEALTPALALELANRCDRLWNVYGPTETTIWSTLYEVRCPKALAGHTFVTIGRPIANTELYVLDAQYNLLPIGVPGELYIGGAGLARGYRNRADLTNERFVRHPFSAEPDARLYRTGDQVRWLADGTLEFLGRIDHQVKLRGYRIELGEIESVLSREPGIREAAVVLREDTPGDSRLVAYFTARDGHLVETADLRQLLQAHLPDYMVPSAFVRLDEMPHTPNGKLDRRALPSPEPDAESLHRSLPPATGTEQSLAQLWTDVLGTAHIGRYDSFFELGGHSLLATQLVSRIRSLWNLDLPLRTIFDAPRLSDLAKRIDAELTSGEHRSSSARAIEPVDRSRPLVLSFAQQRLWFLDQLEPGNPFYNLPTAARLSGPLDRHLLEQSLDELIRRHEGLRTVFPNHAGQAEQQILPAAKIALAVVDLRSLDAQQQQSQLTNQMTVEARKPFDLARGPLLRATLFELGADDHVLLLTMHHIVADGWSLGVMIREIAAIYAALRQGQPSPLPELAVQYADFAAWQKQFLEGDELARQLAWWQEQLANLPAPLDLPTDFTRPQAPQFEGALVTRDLPAGLRDRLHSASRNEEVTFFMTLLAGFQTLLWRYTGQGEFCIGTPVANRTQLEIEPLVGFFANVLVLRAELSDNPTFRELLQRVKQTTLGAYAHQDLPFEKLVETISPERSRDHAPLFQVALVLENAPLPLEQPGGLHVAPLSVDNGTSKYDLTLFCWEHHGRLTLTAEYSTELFQADTIARMLEGLETLLTAAIADPGRRVGELPLVSAREHERLLVDFNATATPVCGDCTLDDLFTRAAEHSPDSVAVQGSAESLTYAELQRRANQLARHLRGLGIGPNSRVGLCLERSPALIVGLLGILKSGAAYVPLDSAWPSARKSALLADAGVSAVLSDLATSEQMPNLAAPIVLLDRDWDQIGLQSAEALVVTRDAADLAYVIYTSGSTGRPKGVEVSHRALVNHAMHLTQRYALKPGDRLLQFISPSFDASAEEIFPALASGATLVLYPNDADRAGRDLSDFCQQQRIDVWHLPATIWKQLVDELSLRGEMLTVPPRVTLVGGESVSRRSLAAWRALTGGYGRFLHAYGLTEVAVTSTLWETTLDREPTFLNDVLPIGRPIANTQAYVLDPLGQLAPVGVPGELYLGGAGLARGYHGREDLTVERFIESPIAAKTGSRESRRLYRTGDRARWLADGNLEFLGRNDDQMKLEGLRIEPGEIEAVLRQDPSVADTIVMLREDEPGRKQLVSYIVPRGEPAKAVDAPAASHAEGEQVAHWHTIFDETYGRASSSSDSNSASEAKFNTVGWNSSYTGQPIPPAEMGEWLDRTVEQVLALKPHGLQRVLEIGCGTGGMLFAIAPHAREYWATDFSAASVQYVEGKLRDLPQLQSTVRLQAQPADDFQGLPEATFDAVILNSVVQYFPSAEYLVRVLEGAARLLTPGGTIFLGDVRSYPLLAPFHASVELSHAADDLSREALLQRVRRRIDQEQELCVDPALFTLLAKQLPQIGTFDIRLKRGQHQNELTRFRYEAVLREGHSKAHNDAPQSQSWKTDPQAIEKLRARLAGERPDCLAFTGIPNARVLDDVRAWKLLGDEAGVATAGDLRLALREQPSDGMDPEVFWRLGEGLGYEVKIGWSHSGGPEAFDVTFRRRDLAAPTKNGKLAHSTGGAAASNGKPSRRVESWQRYTNDPLRGLLTRQLVPNLRKRLENALPPAWIPSAFILLEAFPLTVGGKVDRRALPAPAIARPDWSGSYAAPRDALEAQVAGIWETLLGVRPIGIHDNFFDLGGHSMLAVKLMAEIETACGRRLPLNVLFQRPTVAHLAELIAKPNAANQASSLVLIQPVGKGAPFFCVHPAGGTVFCYRELAAALGEEQPFFGLQAQGLDGEHAPHTRLEDMATHYIGALREVQPHGPYHLGGWSLGGNIAYEMACQLREQGEEVALLALLDAGAMPPDRHTSEEDFLQMVVGLFPGQGQLPLDALRTMTPAEQLRFFVERVQQAQLVTLDDGIAKNAQYVFDVFQANVQAIVEYRPRPYKGRITLLKAAQQAVELSGDEVLGWGPYAAGGIDVHTIPGDHVHMLVEPSLGCVAECLRALLHSSAAVSTRS
jgi:amino acid adenylation domain-containing protein